MSYTQINHEKGMPYGGMPTDALIYKLEETDPALVSEVRGDDPFYDPDEATKEAIKAHLIDWTPDEPFLESDHARRNPATSRTILNLRYSGGRGPNDYRLPQHPELYIGNTGNDPRGVDQQPRFDKMRGHTIARARGKEVRMGNNLEGVGGFTEVQRPWGGTEFEYDRKEMQRRIKDYSKIFAVGKEGIPTNRNLAADEFYGIRQRETIRPGAKEGLYIPEQDQEFRPTANSAENKRAYKKWLINETAPGINTVAGGEFAKVKEQKYVRNGKNSQLAKDYAGVLRVSNVDPRTFTDTKEAGVRRDLAASMSDAAKKRRKISNMKGGDTKYGKSHDTFNPKHTVVSDNAAQIAYINEQQKRGRSKETQLYKSSTPAEDMHPDAPLSQQNYGKSKEMIEYKSLMPAEDMHPDIPLSQQNYGKSKEMFEYKSRNPDGDMMGITRNTALNGQKAKLSNVENMMRALNKERADPHIARANAAADAKFANSRIGRKLGKLATPTRDSTMINRQIKGDAKETKLQGMKAHKYTHSKITKDTLADKTKTSANFFNPHQTFNPGKSSLPAHEVRVNTQQFGGGFNYKAALGSRHGVNYKIRDPINKGIHKDNTIHDIDMGPDYSNERRANVAFKGAGTRTNLFGDMQDRGLGEWTKEDIGTVIEGL